MIKTNSYDEQVKNISAYMWVNEKSVPSLIAYGAYNKICLFNSSKHLIDALKTHNAPFDYIEFPHSGHELQNDNYLFKLYLQKLDSYLKKHLR